MTQIYDPGLQPERTLLAWRRTLLALGVAGLVGLRLLPVAFGPWTLPVPLAVIGAAVALQVVSERRFRQTYGALTSKTHLPAAGAVGLTLALLVTATAAAAVVCVLVLGER
ncbi:DUF202 domain-containing protein [Microbacterium sp. 1.5R]|uniref:DUF202 domain-containing protein n=1 Tax=Microbacterium sp. 1.5R TaxID=1916917 RepID=UPI0011A7A620|nr:DUF202 domain-containing protein [Microbacterium sp. 1.5R]